MEKYPWSNVMVDTNILGNNGTDCYSCWSNSTISSHQPLQVYIPIAFGMSICYLIWYFKILVNLYLPVLLLSHGFKFSLKRKKKQRNYGNIYWLVLQVFDCKCSATWRGSILTPKNLNGFLPCFLLKPGNIFVHSNLSIRSIKS